MIATASVSADTIRDATNIEDDEINDERGDLIIAPQQLDEPLVIAPLETVEVTNENNDLVISPKEGTINEGGENTEGSLISPGNENPEKNTSSMLIPVLAGVALIIGLLVSVLLFKRKK